MQKDGKFRKNRYYEAGRNKSKPKHFPNLVKNEVDDYHDYHDNPSIKKFFMVIEGIIIFMMFVAVLAAIL